MKIRLPEKRFFSVDELAERWGVLSADVEHLIETGQLRLAIRWAAREGKRGVGFIHIGCAKKPSLVLGGAELNNGLLSTSTIDSDTAWIGVYTRDRKIGSFMEAIQTASADPALNENVILLDDVLLFESEYAAKERGACLAVSDNTLHATVAALLASWPGGKPPTGKDLEKSAASVGVAISDDSLRKALKAAREIAPGLPSS